MNFLNKIKQTKDEIAKQVDRSSKCIITHYYIPALKYSQLIWGVGWHPSNEKIPEGFDQQRLIRHRINCDPQSFETQRLCW
jgi:hypothetical protein